jgi:hypothetical protein
LICGVDSGAGRGLRFRLGQVVITEIKSI